MKYWTVIGVFLGAAGLLVGLVALSQAGNAEELAITNSKIERASIRMSNCGVVLMLGGEVTSTEQGGELLAQARSDRDEGRFKEAAAKADEAYFTLGDAGCPSAVDPRSFDDFDFGS